MLADDPEYAALVDDSQGAAALDLLIGEDASALRGLGAVSVRLPTRRHRRYTEGAPLLHRPAPGQPARDQGLHLRGLPPAAPPRSGTAGRALPADADRAHESGTIGALMGTIVRWSPGEIVAAEGAIRTVFAAAFGMSTLEAARFTAALERHATCRDFRFLAATAPEGGRLLGFIYGYSGEPGQWFHDLLRATLSPDLVERWLIGSFELVEFGVVPEAQGRGLGGRLHDALLAEVTNRTAVLTTRQGDTAARKLYLRRGWQEICAEYHFPNNPKPYAILGRDRTPIAP
jgi:GNAT superfamily N-acetyltransferase